MTRRRLASSTHAAALMTAALVIVLHVAGSFLVAAAQVAAPQVDSRAYLDHIKFLASDELRGRGSGTPELDRAADYIADRFRAAGLEPGGDDRTYYQPFEIITGLAVGASNSLTFRDGGGSTTALKLGADYELLSLTGSGDRGSAGQPPLSAPLVFAGYGISAPGYNYDDYAGITVTDKAVLIFRHEPQESDANSIFQGRTHSEHATFLRKAMVARSHGARALLVVDDPNHPDQTNFSGWLREPQAEEYGIPVLRMSRARAQQVVGSLVDFARVTREIDADLKPRSRELDGVSITYSESLTKNRRTVRNVVGILRGADAARSRDAIVLGAHYDHLGLGGRFSLAENAAGQIHNGADDNASGTAAIIEIARLAAANRTRFPRSLVFIAFAGEELGLLGSRYYVNRPAFPLAQTVAMLNLDMVGRAGGRLFVSGTETARDLAAVVQAAASDLPLKISLTGEGSSVGGSSDNTSFLLQRIPSLFFFSGLHADYHRPTDDWEKIDSEGGAAVASLAYEVAERIAARPDRLAFVEPPPQGHTAQASSGSGYGAYFGSVPDFGDSGSTGVKFADVRPDSPAGKAGFRKDDLLVSFDGKPIRTLYDFTFALQAKQPGDKVEAIVLREGKEVKATVELTNRP